MSAPAGTGDESKDSYHGREGKAAGGRFGGQEPSSSAAAAPGDARLPLLLAFAGFVVVLGGGGLAAWYRYSETPDYAWGEIRSKVEAGSTDLDRLIDSGRLAAQAAVVARGDLEPGLLRSAQQEEDLPGLPARPPYGLHPTELESLRRGILDVGERYFLKSIHDAFAPAPAGAQALVQLSRGHA